MTTGTRNARENAGAFAALLVLCLLQAPGAAVVYSCDAAATAGATNSTYKTADTQSLCVHFLPYAIKVGFEARVDDYIALSVRRGFDVVSGFDTDVSVQLSGSSRLSQQIVR